MVGLCRYCAYEQADCKGNKDLEKLKCEYYKKRPVQNVKQMAERIAELEAEVEALRKANQIIHEALQTEVVHCKDCKYWHSNTEFCDVWSHMNIAQRTLADDYCSLAERREESEVEE